MILVPIKVSFLINTALLLSTRKKTDFLHYFSNINKHLAFMSNALLLSLHDSQNDTMAMVTSRCVATCHFHPSKICFSLLSKLYGAQPSYPTQLYITLPPNNHPPYLPFLPFHLSLPSSTAAQYQIIVQQYQQNRFWYSCNQQCNSIYPH